MRLAIKLAIGAVAAVLATVISRSAGSDIRSQAMKLCGMYLPCNRGDAHYSEICQDFGGLGTTCGYLPGWLLYKLGCRDRKLVNRSDAAQGLVSYIPGRNLSDLVQGGISDGIYRSYSVDRLPQKGDFLYFGVVNPGGSVTHEHVAVCKSCPSDGNGDLVTYDLGHPTQPEGSETTRPMTSDGIVIFMGGEARRLIGIVDLESVPITAQADITDSTLVYG